MLNSFFAQTAYRIRTTRRSDAEAGISLRKRRRWFDNEGGDGGDSGGGKDSGKDSGKGGNNQQNTGTPSGQNGGQNNAGETLTLSTAALSERLSRERAQLLRDLGFSSEEDAKKRLADLKKLEDANKTALEKAQAEAERNKAEAERLKAELEAERQARLIDNRNRAFADAAREAGAKKPNRLLLIAEADHPDLLAKTIKEDGSVDDKVIGQIIGKLKESDKELFNINPGSPSNAGGKANLNASEKEAREAARRATGRYFGG